MAKVENILPYDDPRRKAEQVQSMFDGIAPAYDRLNSAMSFGLHRRWLRRLVAETAADAPGAVLDMATGTGDVALALAEALPGARVLGLDLSEGMMRLARDKARGRGLERVEFRQADCTTTGEEADSFDAVTVAYGIRNFADIPAGMAEALRLLRPGGCFHILELSEAPGILKPFYRLYTRVAIPVMGKILSGDRRAYAYLPASIAACPARRRMTAMLEQAGFRKCSFTTLTLGVCTLYRAYKPRE